MSRPAGPEDDREIQDIIRLLVKLWLEEPYWPELVDVVRASCVLPVYMDTGATLFLRPDGKVVRLDHEAADRVPQPETAENWKIVAVVSAAKVYPQLEALVPKRPSGARSCEGCEGRGAIRIDKIDYEFGCGTCHGLGWLAPRQ